MDLNNFLNKEKKITPPVEIIDGTFECDECGDIAFEAILEINTRKIQWVCKNNHKKNGKL